jgi:hypothetical protein
VLYAFDEVAESLVHFSELVHDPGHGGPYHGSWGSS